MTTRTEHLRQQAPNSPFNQPVVKYVVGVLLASAGTLAGVIMLFAHLVR